MIPKEARPRAMELVQQQKRAIKAVENSLMLLGLPQAIAEPSAADQAKRCIAENLLLATEIFELLETPTDA